MKTRYLFSLIVWMAVCINVEAKNDTIKVFPNDTILVTCAEVAHPNGSSIVQSAYMCDNTRGNEFFSCSDGVSILTLVENAINNLYARDNLIVAIISLTVVVMGFWGVRSFKTAREELSDITKEQGSLIERYGNEVNQTIATLNEEAKNLKEKYEEIEKKQSLNNQYMQRINQWMLYNANAIAETAGGGSNTSRDLMAQSQVYYYLMKLFLTDDQHGIDGCINFIKTKAGQEEIEHLKFIVDNDTNVYKKQKAGEAIGYIRGRITNA